MTVAEFTGSTWIRIGLASLGAWNGNTAVGQAPDLQPQGELIKRTYVSSIDGAAIDYALWLPPGYDDREHEPWPLIVFLHGSGEGDNWQAPTLVGASIPVLGARSDLPFVVVFPLMRGSWSINSLAERDVLETVTDVQTHFAVDPDRVHLVGLSLGGFAGWRLACRHPHLWASATLFCSGGQPDLAPNLRHLPIRVYHGAKDASVPVERSREMVAALRKHDIPVQYTEQPQGGHNVWSGPLGAKELYRWIAQQRRVSHPRRISYRTYTLRHGRAYWVTIEAMIDPSVPASVEVFVPPGQTQVFVHAENVGRLVVNPPGEVLDGTRTPAFIVNDQPVTGTRSDRGWSIELPGGPQGNRIKRPGLSGPIQDVLFDRFVVSVANPADGARGEAWAAAVDQALAWTQELTTNNIAVIPADRVTPELMQQAHLICFGDAADHPLLAELVGQVPLHAEAGRIYLDGQPLAASLAALVMIYPNPLAPDRYVVICSGQPAAVGRLAAAALAPSQLSPEPVEDLLLLGTNGKLFRWTNQPQDAEPPAHMGARIPPRGTVFDAAWRLTPAARQRLDTARSP